MKRNLIIDDPGVMSLFQFLSQVYIVRRKLTLKTLSCYRTTLFAFERFLRRPATVADLTTDNVNEFAAKLATALSAKRIRKHTIVLKNLQAEAVAPQGGVA